MYERHGFHGEEPHVNNAPHLRDDLRLTRYRSCHWQTLKLIGSNPTRGITAVIRRDDEWDAAVALIPLKMCIFVQSDTNKLE